MPAAATDRSDVPGPLAGLRVIEFVGIGPGPHCAMLLADLGADVVRIDRAGGNGWPNPVADRGRATVEVDIRSEEGRSFCLEALDAADVVIEGYRPGVMEKLGLGPDIVCGRNPRLIYGRITGWGQTGPLSQAAGHDINYIAVTGALAAIGEPRKPATPPLNLVGDFGGGSMLLAFGILAAVVERGRSGCGQVIDAAIVDGTASMMSMFAGMVPTGQISMDRGSNLLAGAAPFYRCYHCSDGGEVAIGPIEPHFYSELLKRVGAPTSLFEERENTKLWPEHGKILAEIFGTRSVAEWCALLEGSDTCFAPVVELGQSPQHRHMAERGVYVEHRGLLQAGPVPRFSRTPGSIQPDRCGAETIARWKQIPADHS